MADRKKLLAGPADLQGSEHYMRAARYDLATRPPGKTHGALGVEGTETFAECLLAADETGAVDMSPVSIADKIGQPLSWVDLGLKRLTKTGALIRDGNAYRVNLDWSPNSR